MDSRCGKTCVYSLLHILFGVIRRLRRFLARGPGAAAPLAAASLHSGPMIVDFSRRFPPWRRRGHRISFPSRGCRHYRPLPLEFPGHSQNPSTGVLDCPIYLPACDSPGCSGRLHSTTTQPSADISTAGPIIPGWPATINGKCSSTPAGAPLSQRLHTSRSAEGLSHAQALATPIAGA